MDWAGLEYLVVGAGLSGLTVARCLKDAGRKVVVVERRAEPGGLAAAYTDQETGIECHAFGTHVFHTRDRRAYEFLTRFCALDGYRHRVMARSCGRYYPWPVNLMTINSFYGLGLTPRQAAGFLRILSTTYSDAPIELLTPPAGSKVAPCGNQGDARERRRLRELPAPRSLRDAAVAKMGAGLYDAFVKGYSRKQWGCDPAALPAALAARIPVRTDYNFDLFDDPWQGLPENGWAAVFAAMADKIDVVLGVDFFTVKNQVPPGCRVVYTGPLDRWFEYRMGALSWRGVYFEAESIGVGDAQGAAVVNHCDEETPYTRTHEYKHLRPAQRHSRRKTVVAREYPTDGGDPAYPAAPNGSAALRYVDAAAAEEGVYFCGRLATYRYLNMDEAIVEALGLAETLCTT